MSIILGELPSGTFSSVLASNSDLIKKKAIRKSPFVITLDPDEEFMQPPTPTEFGAEPDSEVAPECEQYGDIICDRYALFDPRRNVRRLCAKHMDHIGPTYVRAWADSVLMFLEQHRRIDKQLLAFADFHGGTDDDRLEFPAGSRFSGIDLLGAQFINCDLVDSLFDGKTEMYSVLFHNCNLSLATFAPTVEMERVQFERCDLKYATFSGGSISNALISGGNFSGARLNGLKATHLRMKDVKFEHSRLEHVRFRNVLAEGCSWDMASISGQLIESTIVDSDLTNVNFTEEFSFRNSLFNRCTLSKKAKHQLEGPEKHDQLELRDCRFVDIAPSKPPEKPTVEMNTSSPLAMSELREMCQASLGDIARQRGSFVPTESREATSRATRNRTNRLGAFVAISFGTGLILDSLGVPASWAAGACAGGAGTILDYYLPKR